jgi:hypothetical protein
MSVWLNNYLAEDREFKINGREFWRTLQHAFRSEVDECNRLYAAAGQPILRIGDCAAANPNCFRVTTGQGESERYVQLSIDPERLEVCIEGSAIPANAAPYRVSLDAGGLSLFEGESLVSFETITRKALEPLMFPGGSRRVPV